MKKSNLLLKLLLNDQNLVYYKTVIDAIIKNKNGCKGYIGMEDMLDISNLLPKLTFMKIIKDVLKQLESQCMIIYNKCFRLYKLNGEYKNCNINEMGIMLDIITDANIEFGITCSEDITEYLKDDYYKFANKNIKEKLGYDYYTDTFELILADGIFD